MNPAYKVYLNGHFFDHLLSSEAYGDRPEPHRQHEQALWTVYQLLRLGEHEAAITDTAGSVVFRTKSAADLKSWFQQLYPDFIAQLDRPVHTRYPHPADALKRP
ncbi:MAG: hypothetical protein ACRYFX_23335 [Janthinobacterium lividum]